MKISVMEVSVGDVISWGPGKAKVIAVNPSPIGAVPGVRLTVEWMRIRKRAGEPVIGPNGTPMFDKVIRSTKFDRRKVVEVDRQEGPS